MEVIKLDRQKFLYEYHKGSDQLDKRRMKKIITKSIDSMRDSYLQRGHHQMIIVMEELAELSQQTSKQLRGHGDKFNMLEEMADVYLCLEYLKEICGITTLELHTAVNVKLDRLDKVLNEMKEVFTSEQTAKKSR